MPAGPALEMEATSAAPGGRVAGRARGAESVELVRRERTPSARGSFHVAVCRTGAGGRFELTVPEDAPPSAGSERCRLSYAVIARRGGGRRERCALAEEVVVAGGPVPAHLTPGPRDRLIASFDARRFHVELAEADLRGGGGVAGRVHAHHGSPPDAIVVCARLLECWRIQRPWNVHMQPLWRDEVVWESAPLALRWPAQRRWLPFGFPLPPDLPPAVEGRLMAWRYEVEARRPVRFAFDQRAVLTPIGFQAA